MLRLVAEGVLGAIKKSQELLSQDRRHFISERSKKRAGPEFPRRTTAGKIWEDTDRHVDVSVAGVWTEGTTTGVAEVIKARKPSLHAVALKLAGAALSSGHPAAHRIRDIGARFVSESLNSAIID